MFDADASLPRGTSTHMPTSLAPTSNITPISVSLDWLNRMLHSSSSSSTTTSTTTASLSNNDQSSIVDAKIADARAKYDAVVQLLRNSGGKIRNSRSRSVCAVVRSRWLAVQNTDAADNNIDVVKCQRLSQAIAFVVFLCSLIVLVSHIQFFVF